MKKLLLFLILGAIPAVAMQPQTRVNLLASPATQHAPALYINPIVHRFKGTDAPEGSAVSHIVHDTTPEIVDYESVPSSFIEDPLSAQTIDSNGRNVIWWVALMGKKNIYNALIKIGANPDVKSTRGLLAGLSARELIEMDPEEIEAIIEAGPNASKSKL